METCGSMVARDAHQRSNRTKSAAAAGASAASIVTPSGSSPGRAPAPRISCGGSDSLIANPAAARAPGLAAKSEGPPRPATAGVGLVDGLDGVGPKGEDGPEGGAPDWGDRGD